MNTEEADELFALMSSTWKIAEREVVWRARQRFLESGVLANTARELILQHAETHQWFTLPDLLVELAKVCNPTIDAQSRMKAVALAAAARRNDEREAKKAADASWEKLKAWLAKQPAEVLEKLKAAAVEGLPESFAPFARRDPIHPVIAARMVTVFKAQAGMVGACQDQGKI